MEKEFKRGKFIQETVVTELADGSFTKTETSKSIYANDEPDYIKLYTKHWFDINKIPEFVRDTFLQLALRMTYCNATDLNNSQIVYTTGVNKIEIMKVLNITNDQVWYRHINTLVECKAIGEVYAEKRVKNKETGAMEVKKVKVRGCYQINPKYAGRGPWEFSTKSGRGGIKKLIAHFDYLNGEVDVDAEFEEEAPFTEEVVYGVNGYDEDAHLYGIKEDESMVMSVGKKLKEVI